MRRSVDGMRGYRVCGRNGAIGHIDQFLFDDRSGSIRYLVVRIGGWLLGRHVLLEPSVLGTVITPLQTLDVTLTQQQIEQSPALEKHPPVSQQYTSAYGNDNISMIGWEMLPGSWLLGVAWYVAQPPGNAQGAPQSATARTDQHLRSTREVIGYRLQASDGASGRVVDFIVDDSAWVIRSVVVDTGTWWPGRQVVLPWQQITHVHWHDATVEVELLSMAVKRYPTYDPAGL